MAVEAKQLATVFVKACYGRSQEDIKKAAQEFVRYLSEEGLLTQWRDIEREIHTVWKELYGVSKVTIVSAHTLTSQARQSLTQLAKGAEVTERIDKRLIGGSVLRVDDLRIDGSVTGRLRELKRSLTA